MVFGREVEGKTLTLGTSGLLRQSNLIMWDHETESWWQQGTAEAIVGEMAGTMLDIISSQVVTWDDFYATHPDGTALDRKESLHGLNPYVGYDTTLPFLFREDIDSRLPGMERVIGMSSAEGALAIPFAALAEKRAMNFQFAGRMLAAFYEPRGLSTLDVGFVKDARSVGTASLFNRELDGEVMDFEWRGDAIYDIGTSTRWDMLGKAVEGELEGSRLGAAFHSQSFWFYWAAVHPDTNVTQIPKCVEEEVDVELVNEGQPVEILEEVAKNIRGQLVNSGVPAYVIGQVVKEVHTELVKEVIEQLSAKTIGEVEKTVEVKTVIDESEGASHKSTCIISTSQQP